MEYEVREYRPGEEEQIVPLLQLIFYGWQDLDFWRWKYLDNPLKMNFIIVAESNGKIIGTDGAVLRRVKVGDSVLLGNYGTDGGTHPDFRRMGVYNNILNFKKELQRKAGIELDYFGTVNPLIFKYHSKTHFTFPYFLRYLIRIRDMDLHNRMNPSESLTARVLKLGLHAIKLLNDLRNTLSPPSANKDIKVTEISEFNDRANTFWNEIKDHYDFIVERTREHLNWNYCDPRGGNFTVKLAEAEGRMLGYIVLGMDKTRDYGRGEIIDLLTVPGNLNVADVLLEDANRFYDDNDINSVTSLVVEGHPYEMAFRRHGFLKLRRKMHVFYQCPEKDEAFARRVKGRVDTTEAGKVHLSRGDLI